jgi:hypothetical protein
MGSAAFRLAEPLFLHHRRDVAAFDFPTIFRNVKDRPRKGFGMQVIFAPYKSVLEPTGSHNHPAAIDWKIDRLEKSRDTMAGT